MGSDAGLKPRALMLRMTDRHDSCVGAFMTFRRPRRLPGFNYVGKHRYFVTCCVAERRAAFTSAERVHCVRAQILRTCHERGFEDIANVYMPDHVHLMVRGPCEEAAFVPFMTLVRQRTAVAYKKLVHERLWQDGYNDRILRSNDDTCRWVEYILQIPFAAAWSNTRKRIRSPSNPLL